ncbi:diguanylate cyclase [Clostridium folliculivorans]|uniref:Diguanylate cyclase n=2 Tax=Clostridium folliculivorans TaxID=2886038 RepID=A0A9W5Y1W9_9CLOT|nr:diguanylate cyclase [Clostridium folliculivorans]GKU31188.1 diguanylate cyclase [Clostridium folliculivorans]
MMFKKNTLILKKQNLILIFFIFITLFLFGCDVQKDDIPRAFQGKVDLSNVNFDNSRIAKLDGQWELYWGQLLEPKDFNNDTRKADDYLQVPSTVKVSEYNKTLPKYGYGTMRLRIKMKPDDDRLYGIKTQYILSASKIWVNGKLLASSGQVSKDEYGAAGSFEHQIAFFNNDKSEVEIVIQMSNFNNVVGKVQSIYIGDAKQIKKEYVSGVASDAFIIGALVIMGIYHFALYYRRPQNKAPLYFGIFCLCISLRNAIVSERIIFDIIPNISFALFNKLAYLTVYISLPFIVMFFKEIFEHEFSAKVVKAMNIISILVSVITICTSIEVYDTFLLYFEIWGVLLFIYILYIIVKDIINKNKGAIIILLGFLVFLTAVIHDILLQAGMMYTKSLTPIGLFIFIFSQSYILAAKFSDAFEKVEKLVEENKAVYIDELTGLLNRRGLYEQGRSLFRAAQITGGKFTLFYGDLNRLKKINDFHGHKEGDEAIRTAANLLRMSFGKDDIVAHISGDEFIAIAVNKASKVDAKVIIDFINHNFNKYNQYSDKTYPLSISIGYSIYKPNVKTTFENMIHEADIMLYDAKTLIEGR